MERKYVFWSTGTGCSIGCLVPIVFIPTGVLLSVVGVTWPWSLLMIPGIAGLCGWSLVVDRRRAGRT